MSTPKHCSQLKPKQADSFSYEGTTTEKNDQIYLNNMELSQSRNSIFNILDSGNCINSNLFNHSSIQSFRVSKSNTIDNDNNTNTKENDPNITIGEIQNEFITEENNPNHINETPISTLCNYYLKSEINSSKTKSQMKSKQISPIKITEFNYIPFTIENYGSNINAGTNSNTTTPNANSKIVSNVIALKVSQRLVLNSLNRVKEKKFIFNALNGIKNDNGNKNRGRCRSSSVKTKPDKEKAKTMMIETVKRIYHSMKRKADDINNKRNNTNGIKAKIVRKQANDKKRSNSKKELASRNNCNNNTSIEDKMSITAKTTFNHIKKLKQSNHHPSIPINHLYYKKRRRPLPAHPLSNTSTKSNQGLNTIVLEVTENDIIALGTAKEMKEKKLIDLFKRRNQSQKQSDQSKRNKHFNKKPLCDSNISYTHNNTNTTTRLDRTVNDNSFKDKHGPKNIIDIDLNSNHSKRKNSNQSKMMSLRKIKTSVKPLSSTRGNINKESNTVVNILTTENSNSNKTMPFSTKASDSKSKSKTKRSQITITTPYKTIKTSKIMTISSKKFMNIYNTNPIKTALLNSKQSQCKNNEDTHRYSSSSRKNSKENQSSNTNTKRLTVIGLTNNIKHITITPHLSNKI